MRDLEARVGERRPQAPQHRCLPRGPGRRPGLRRVVDVVVRDQSSRSVRSRPLKASSQKRRVSSTPSPGIAGHPLSAGRARRPSDRPPRARAGRPRRRRWPPARRSRWRVCSSTSLISSGVRPLRSAAAHVHLALVAAAHGDQRDQRHAAAGAPVEARPRPDLAPRVARDEVLELLGEVRRALDRAVDVRVAEHPRRTRMPASSNTYSSRRPAAAMYCSRRAWRSAARSSATTTWTGRSSADGLHRRLPGLHHALRVGRDLDRPASTGASAA